MAHSYGAPSVSYDMWGYWINIVIYFYLFHGELIFLTRENRRLVKSSLIDSSCEKAAVTARSKGISSGGNWMRTLTCLGKVEIKYFINKMPVLLLLQEFCLFAGNFLY